MSALGGKRTLDVGLQLVLTCQRSKGRTRIAITTCVALFDPSVQVRSQSSKLLNPPFNDAQLFCRKLTNLPAGSVMPETDERLDLRQVESC